VSQGTQYQIAYAFQFGYSYQIIINAAVINSTNTGGNASAVFNLNSGGNGNNFACSGKQNISNTTSGNLIRGQVIQSNNFTDYTLSWNTLSSAYSFLTVGAVNPSGVDNSQTILIRKITIVGTPPPPTFTLTPNSLSAICGQSISQTFTINNVYNSPGVSSYVWNLGANNGWLYNGSPASNTITTTTNTINLTSSGCSNVSNLSASAVISGVNYNTNTTTINNQSPISQISGSESICTGTENYEITGLPCSATLTWSVQPANNTVIQTINNNQISLQRNGSANGIITLTATVANACGNTITVNKTINVGTERPSNYTICGYDPNDGCRYPKILFNVLTSYPNGSTYKWYINNILTATTTAPTWTYNLNPGDCGTYLELSVIVSTVCGDSYPAGEIVYYACESGFSRFTASPNPTTGDVLIETSASDKNISIKEIQILDKYGAIKKQVKLSVNSKKHKISIADLPADFYVLRIYDGKIWISKKIVKK